MHTFVVPRPTKVWSLAIECKALRQMELFAIALALSPCLTTVAVAVAARLWSAATTPLG